MGRRRRKEIRIIKKKLPEFYLCPRCGKNTVIASVNKKEGNIRITCSNCKIRDLIKGLEMEAIDAYNLFVDTYYGNASRE